VTGLLVAVKGNEMVGVDREFLCVNLCNLGSVWITTSMGVAREVMGSYENSQYKN